MRRLLSAWCVSVACVGWIAGCGSGDDFQEYSEAPQREAEHHHHHHHEAGPHGGHLIELGDHQYHAELVFNAESRTAAVYILASDGKSAFPIESGEVQLHLTGEGGPVELVLTPAPQDDDPEGTASRFETGGESLPGSLKDEEDFTGTVHVAIGENSFEGKITHDHAHDDHHDHAH